MENFIFCAVTRPDDQENLLLLFHDFGLFRLSESIEVKGLRELIVNALRLKSVHLFEVKLIFCILLQNSIF